MEKVEKERQGVTLNENTLNKRIISFDIIRIFAIFAVVMIHIAAPLISGGGFLIANIFDSLSWVGVPLFVLLSGALMLNEDKNLPQKYFFKRALILFVLLYLWSSFYVLIYQIALPLLLNQKISIKTVFFNLFLAHGGEHFWYLFMAIGLYLITPVLRLFVKRENKKAIGYIILLSLIFQFVPEILDFIINKTVAEELNIIQKYTDFFYLDFVGGFLAYYLIGWYCTTIQFRKTLTVWIYILGGLGLIATILTVHFCGEENNSVWKLFYSNLSINIFLYSLSIFVLIFNLTNKMHISQKWMSFIKYISTLTFGVYLIHPLIITLFNLLFEIENLYLYVTSSWLFVITISFLVSFLIYKIPLLKKLIKG